MKNRMTSVVLMGLSLGALFVHADTIPLEQCDMGRMRSGFGSAKSGKSVDGNALRVGGVEYRRGVGTHAPSTHRIAANGNALSFSALVGVDDECGGKGSVVFRVIADGKVVAEVAAKGGEAAKRISADLAGTKRIVLEVTDGGDGMHYDHADWCDAVFTFKDGTKPLSAAEMTRQLGILTPPGDGSPRINAPARYGVRPGHPILFKVPVVGDKPMKIEVSRAGTQRRRELLGHRASAPLRELKFDPENRLVSGSLSEPGEYPLVITAENAKGKAEKVMTLVVGDKIALTPPMGWNSWNAFAGGVSEAKMRIATDKIVELGLDEHGYSYVNIDDFWQKNPQNGTSDPTLAGPERNADGTIAPNARFPDMKALADYIHSKGLKAGLYSSPGPYTCGGCTGSWQHELQDAQSYAAWGFDYLKYDWCSYGEVATGDGHDRFRRPYLLMGRFLKMQSRDIVFSLCQYGWDEVETWGALADGQLWRTTGDIFDNWNSVYGGITAQAKLWPSAGPGAWNDADMLVLGRSVWGGSLTPNEMYTHFSMWCMFASPLMIGCDLANVDDFTLSLLTNDEVLAIDQDELGAGAAKVLADAAADWEIWARPLADGSMALALLNVDEEEQIVTVPFAKLGLRGAWAVRDLWRQADEGTFADAYAASVPGHATHLVKFSPRAGAGLKPCLRDIRDNAWRLPFDAARAAARGTSAASCGGCD